MSLKASYSEMSEIGQAPVSRQAIPVQTHVTGPVWKGVCISVLLSLPFWCLVIWVLS
jgi:hypothetical protein